MGRDAPPFYGYVTKPAILSTKGGMKVNPKCRMVGVFGDIIPGFYAAGEIMGGVHGGGYITGSAVAKAIVFGRIAGTNAAAEKPAKEEFLFRRGARPRLRHQSINID